MEHIVLLGGSTSGTAFEDDGVTPVANASVFAMEFDTRDIVTTTTIGADGDYFLEPLLTGDCGGAVDARSHGFVPESYNNNPFPFLI